MKRKNVFVCTLLIGCMMLTACGSSSTANTTTESTTITDADGNAITLADLTEATMVTVKLDDDGNAASISISGMDMNTMPAPMPE